MKSKLVPLDRLKLVDKLTGDYRVVAETPRGSRNKYKYDRATGTMQLGAVLGEGLAFPYDFGFFPSTLGDDGDPLDVLLFLDTPLAPGCVATARVIGVMEVEQKGRGRHWERNDRFMAVATHAHTHQHLRHIDDLEAHLLPEIEAFFQHYARASGKKRRIVGHGGPGHAARLLRKGARKFRSDG